MKIKRKAKATRKKVKSAPLEHNQWVWEENVNAGDNIDNLPYRYLKQGKM